MTDTSPTQPRAQSKRGARAPTVRRWLSATVAYVVVLMVGLLAPFDVYPGNDATPIGRGLEFRGAGIARSVEPPVRLHQRLVATGAVTVEVWAAAAARTQHGPARLVSYSHSIISRNFTLAQEDDDLHVRLRTTESGPNGTHPALTVEDVFRRPRRRHIVLTYDGAEKRVYVDGVLRKSSRALRGSFDTWDPEHQLVLGNEVSGTRPWRGQLGLVAIYDRALGPQEVARNHAGLAGGAGGRVVDGLVALYRPGEGNRHVRDESGLSPPLDLEIPKYVGRHGDSLTRTASISGAGS